MESLQSLIPEKPKPQHLLVDKAFSRERKLPFPSLVSSLLSFTATSKHHGLDVKIREYLRSAFRNGCNTQSPSTLDKSALSRSRSKVSWLAFESIFQSARDLALESMGDTNHFLWKEKSIYAMDGSKFTLPASSELRAEFDPNSGLHVLGKGHYPQALVMTITDVLRQLPIARKITPCDRSERHEAMDLIELVPENGVILGDRGFPGHEFFSFLMESYKGHFVIRCPVKSSFKEIERMKKSDCTLTIKGLVLRAIRLVSPDGTESVLFTNLMDKKKYSAASIRNLYYKRWQIETHYRDEKCSMDLEHFHSKSSNGIKQELFASLIMMTMARILMHSQTTDIERAPQFKYAICALAKEAYLLVANKPKVAARLFKDLVEDIRRVIYYKPRHKRKSYPRISKTAQNKWREKRTRVVHVP